MWGINTAESAEMIELPTPSGYRQTVPGYLNIELGAEDQRAERRRRFGWFAVAVALHCALLLALLLTPPLRLKASYAPERWVQILTIPDASIVPARAPQKAPAARKKP